MSRATIDFGIDLGTTNSAIAVVNGNKAELFPNFRGDLTTPSAVWIDAKKRMHVGQTAKDRLESDPENATSEFKLLMGLPANKSSFEFQITGKRMSPQALSAWVLRALKRDVQKLNGEDVRAAVITVPAAFDLPQSEATKEAAKLAGFVETILLPEPVAAGLAYGFQSERDNLYWLVYDFGGGTFDAAVLQLRGGEIQVVKHKGDNHLGGKLIDWKIVEQLLVPAVLEQASLTKFERSNPKWRSAFAKLKWWAEQAKKEVSSKPSSVITIDLLCEDDRGQPVSFEYELTRAEVNQIMDPFLSRSINLCRDALAESQLEGSEIDRVLLVGGPTLSPYLRQQLMDPTEGLGIPLEFRINPMTVVAEGAAIFAASQHMPAAAQEEVEPGAYALDLDYTPIGHDSEPMIGGRALGTAGEEFSGFTIEFINSDPASGWRSGKIDLSEDGGFFSNLWADQGRTEYQIELCNSGGLRVATTPDRVSYTFGTVAPLPPLAHSLGVAMANNEVDVLIAGGASLPARRTVRHRTVYPLGREETNAQIKIPIVEGGFTRADRNPLVGQLVIDASNVRRDVPAGSQIEITLEMSAKHEMTLTGFIPLIDQEFPTIISYQDYQKQALNPKQLKEEIQSEKTRLDEVRERVQEMGDSKGLELLAVIRSQGLVNDIDDRFSNAKDNPEVASDCRGRLLALRVALDAVEEQLKLPVLEAEADESMELLQNLFRDFPGKVEQRRVDSVLNDLRAARSLGDPDLLRRRIRECDAVRFSILRELPEFWIHRLNRLEEQQHSMTDSRRAVTLCEQGQRAASERNWALLQAVVGQLEDLLPVDATRETGYGGGTTN